MKVLVATYSTAIRGGVESYLAGILPLLERAGIEVGLATELQPERERRLEAPRKHLNWGIATTADVKRLVNDWRPDVVMQNGMFDPLIEAALLSEAPAVLFAHNYYGTCVSGRKRFAFPSLRVCHRHFGVACLALYLPRRCGGLNPATALQHFDLQRRRLEMLPRYRYVLVASEAMKQEYLRHEVSIDQLRVVPYFVDDEKEYKGLANSTGRDRHGPLLMVSRLVPDKGAKELIEAAARAQAVLGWPLQLVFAGTGSIEPLRRLAARHAVIASFVGWVSAERRSELMAEAAVLAVPSVWPEPFGIVGIEAGILGLPTVAFATGGIVDWLVDGESGVAAPGERPCARELAAALVSALADEKRYTELCAGARRVAVRFSANEHVNKLVSALDNASRQHQ